MFSQLCRLGADAVLRYTNSGDPVFNASLCYTYGKRVGGVHPVQWIDATMFGKRAEALMPYLKKGHTHVFHLNEVHIKTLPNGQAALAGMVVDITLCPKSAQPVESSAP